MSKAKPTALVTGGNRGMGLATCRELGLRDYKVILAARETQSGNEAAEVLRSEGLDVEAFRLDLTRAEDIAALIEHARRWLERVDVLVNNAGIYLETAGPDTGERVSVFDARMEVVRSIIETNLLGHLSLSQGLIALMRKPRIWTGGERVQRHGSAVRYGRWRTGLPHRGCRAQCVDMHLRQGTGRY